MTRKRIVTKRTIAAVLALFAVPTLLIATLTSHTFARNWAQATSMQPERYTTLAFTDTGHLPQYSAAGKQQHVVFRLTNHEAVPTAYHYIALLSSNGGAQVLAQGDVRLGNDATTQQTVLYTMPAPNLTAQVIVELQGRSE